MAADSSSPPNPVPAGGAPQNSAEAVQPANEVKQDAAPENPKSVFVNSEPIREDQVQNAVKFLSHPKVKDSPVFHRRNFLEKKGLTKEEIDEAFRRVPDPSPSAQTTSTNQAGQGITTSNSQPTAVVQAPLPVATVPPSGGSSSMVALARSRFHWYHAVVAIGFLAASGAGTAIWVKKSMIPRLKSWIRKVVLEEKDGDGDMTNIKPTLAEEAAAAAKAAAAAATEVAKASQEMIISRHEEKVNMEKFMDLLQMQVKEMRSMGNAIQQLEGRSDKIETTRLLEHGGYSGSITNLKPTYATGKPEIDSRSARSSSPPTTADQSAPPHPSSYMDIMAMVQRGERPPNIRDINDQPPNPNQQISNPRLAPRSKPWEGDSQAQTTTRGGFGSSLNAEGGSAFGAQNNGVSYQVDAAENTVPWWKKKNPRITEVDYVEAKPVPTTVAQTSEQPPIQRTWVPPMPPPVVMPEAAEAIRRPKSKKEAESVTQEMNGGGPPAAAEVTDELQRVTKISESGGGEVEEVHNGGQETNGGLKLSEIEEEPVQSY